MPTKQTEKETAHWGFAVDNLVAIVNTATSEFDEGTTG